MRQLLVSSGNSSIQYKSIWPNKHQFALVLTHDIETAEGQAFVRKVADMEENLGFRSSFNFVLERYPLDFKLIQELRERGFEVGCHGLKHDGKLFSNKKEFLKRVAKINQHLKEYRMVGFRAPLTHRNPEWMQALEIEYDLSFFDTDPFEPIPGGTMSIWPFFIGHFVELPYTLVQDYTLTSVLGETTPRLWLEKVDFIKKFHGMALLNSHPDYLNDPNSFRVYAEFLETMKKNEEYWHAWPGDVASWWKSRAESAEIESSSPALSTVRLEGEMIAV
jgi:peptidoglycan/xylan/chitin deacetylase (PgdA/CDA1 family)